MATYNLIEFWNSCDLGNYLYQAHFKQRFYFEQTVGLPEYLKEEEGTTDGKKRFIPSFQKIKKIYQIDFGLVPEYMVDALQVMQLHDTKWIYLTDGGSGEMQDIELTVEWERLGCYAQVKMKFSTEFINKTACCSDRSLCLALDGDCIGVEVYYGNAKINDPEGQGVTNGSRYLFWNTNPAIGKYTGSVYTYINPAWVEKTEWNVEGSLIEDIPDDQKLYYDGVYWWQVPLVNSYDASTDDLVLYGFCIPDTLTHIIINVDGVITTSDVYLSNVFNSDGITFINALHGGYSHVDITIHCYTHSCDYGDGLFDFSAPLPE
jgi:hypothetical protein